MNVSVLHSSLKDLIAHFEMVKVDLGTHSVTRSVSQDSTASHALVRIHCSCSPELLL
jgi:hypothetical protein